MSKLRFDGKTVLITGGSRGLGRAFALEFARLGAKVVINSLGNPDEEHPEMTAAEFTLREIQQAGGEGAVINCPAYEASRIISFCQDTFGQLDVVVHSAGIVKDNRLVNISDQDWQEVRASHLDAAFALTKAAWPLFLEQGGGRVLYVGSSSGLYGNFGQANYSAAKAGLIGLAQAVALEGAKRNIHANIVAPVGVTQMNRHLIPQQSHDSLKAEHIATVVAWLCHQNCEDNGSIYEAAGGWVGKVRWERSAGLVLPESAAGSGDTGLEEIAERWAEAADFSQSSSPDSAQDSLAKILAQLG